MSAVRHFSYALLSCVVWEASCLWAFYATDVHSGWHTFWGALAIIIVPTLSVYTAIILLVYLVRKWFGYQDKIGE